jgi:hypothetical protein
VTKSVARALSGQTSFAEEGFMRVAEIIRRRIRKSSDGVDFAGDINAAIAANVGERGTSTHAQSSSSQRIVQRSGRTHVSEPSKRDQTDPQ